MKTSFANGNPSSIIEKAWKKAQKNCIFKRGAHTQFRKMQFSSRSPERGKFTSFCQPEFDYFHFGATNQGVSENPRPLVNPSRNPDFPNCKYISKHSTCITISVNIFSGGDASYNFSQMSLGNITRLSVNFPHCSLSARTSQGHLPGVRLGAFHQNMSSIDVLPNYVKVGS